MTNLGRTSNKKLNFLYVFIIHSMKVKWEHVWFQWVNHVCLKENHDSKQSAGQLIAFNCGSYFFHGLTERSVLVFHCLFINVWSPLADFPGRLPYKLVNSVWVLKHLAMQNWTSVFRKTVNWFYKEAIQHS